MLSLLNKEGTTSSSGPSDITGSGSKKKKRSRGSATATPSNNQASSEALSSDDPASTSSNGYMILLATHILNRLLAYTGSLMVDDESNQKREKVAQVVSFITYLLSRILLPTPDSKSEDRALLKLLERACASNARSLLGRAILSISVASTWALEHLTSDQCGNNDNSSLEYWIPATLALDSVVRLSHHCPKSQQAVTVAPLTGASPSGNSTTGAYPVKFWDRSQALFEEKAMSIFTRESAKKHLESTCEEVSDLPLQYEEACLIALLANPSTATAIEEATTSPPAKRGSGSRQTRKKSGRGVAASTSEAEGNSQEVPSSSSSLGQSFSALINDAPNAKWNNIRIDGRVAVKRWSSMGLVWLFKGHMRVLEATLGMLKDRSQWQSVVWDIYGSSAEEPRKKNKTSADSAQSDDRIPGNAALVALISRLMGAISEMHAQSGSRAPAGGFEAYAKLIIPADSDSVETSVATKSPSKSKTTKTVPLDLRNIAIVVFYHLLQAHEDCLKTNFCNDDVQLLNNESKNPNMQYKFSPVLNRLIQGLSRVAAATSCTTLSFTDQTLEMQRLEKIAAAFILKIMKDGKTTATEEESSAAMEADPPRLQCPIDVQLVDFAILQLSDCLEKVDKSLSDTKDERKTSSNHAVGVIAHYRLEEPLSIPDLVKVSIAPVPSTGQRRRGSKASATMLHATTSSQACSYAGAFRGNDSDEQKSASEDNILSLFLRALVSPMKNDSPVAKSSKGKKKKKTKSQARENDGPTCQSKLYGTLIDILSLCYNGAGSMNELVQEKPETNSAVNRKREISSTKGPARKRRRTNEAGGSEETVSDCLNSTATMSEVSKEQTRFQNALNLQTANLAQNTTDVLRICISTSLDGATGSSTAQLSLAGALRQSIRDAIEGEHLSEVTELVRRLDSIVVLPRTIHGKALKEKERKQRSEDIDSPRFSSFAAFERDLW